MFKDSVVLITGGTGSWGNELIKQLLEKDPKKIIVFSRGELAQVMTKIKFNNNPKLHFVIGDVRDADAVDRLFSQISVDYVYHLAALKHVPVCENQPQEAIKTNITGTTNLVNAAIKYKVKRFIDVSTDKAVSPTNLYGYTKAVGEKLVIQANALTKDTDFVCIRGGNVLGSNGSVVPIFIDQIKNNNEITITVGNMTRYFLTLPEAIHLLFKASDVCVGGETFVMNMPSFYISELGEVLIDYYGNLNTRIKEIGIREGEKMDELLISEHEAPRSYVFNDDYYVIKPDLELNRDFSYLNSLSKVSFDKFSSADNLKGKEFLRGLLDKGGFLL
jgi:FlaA1/EpsC-like NDP-sugar epimerase